MLKIYFYTLGCPKNEVDSEYMEGILDRDRKIKLIDDIKEAQVIIINTCGFIDDAKEESIDSILKACYYKKHGNCRSLIVTGCLTQRYQDEIMDEIPEIDVIMGTGNLDKIRDVVYESLSEKRLNKVTKPGFKYYNLPRKLSTSHYAYVKIAEGCNNNCSYCIIPRLRGPIKSREIEDIYQEVKSLVASGIKEIILIAQDTTRFGIDIYGKPALEPLLKKLVKINNLKWLRLLYSYPEHISPSLVNLIAEEKKICNYLDLPVQHSANEIRKLMKREGSRDDIVNQLKMINNKIPDISIRTTLIVGFPGETEENFNDLVKFIKQIKFDRLGVFKYSREEGTPAAKYENQVPEKTKENRYNKIMQLQQSISETKNRDLIGKEITVLIDRIENDYAHGRTEYDAPDIDNQVIIPVKGEMKSGDFVKCRITEAYEYDLLGEEINEST